MFPALELAYQVDRVPGTALAWAGGTEHTVPELLNRFVADGWELASLRDYREGGDGSP